MTRLGQRRPGQVAAVCCAVLALACQPLYAIPSPDLVINFAASAAQVLGLLTVVFGTFAVSRRRGPKGAAGSPARRWPFRVCLGALLLSLGANVYQYSTDVDARNRRLRTNLWRSSTEEGKKVGDANLKTLSASEQDKHPLAVSSEELIRWQAEGRPLNLIDVREPEEVEMGVIGGTWHRRYPDLRANREGLVEEGKETVLICDSGNRSSELATEFLEKHGIRCRFMVGGYEKWIANGEPLVNEAPRAPGEIRDIPDFPNKWTLLDTPDVEALMAKETILFVDVRYPGDFDLGHLPDAVNLPLRKMLADEMHEALLGLPRLPVVAPCYDKRSSFYGMILGLRLSRLGFDFRGRYTVPHEFAVAKKDKAWVEQWKDEEEGKTLLGMVSRPLVAALDWLKRATGNLALAILILVIALRALCLPVTLRAERDQWMQRRLAGRVAELKGKLKEDPQRLGRALLNLYRQHDIRPLRTMLGTSLQVFLFVFLFTVVSDASPDANQGFLWVPSLARPDPRYILPAAASGVILAYLWLGAAKRAWWKLLAHGVVAALLFTLIFQLPGAVTLYLVINLSLLLLQSRLTLRYLGRRQTPVPAAHPAPPPKLAGGVSPLRLAHQIPGAGNKAARLGSLAQAGFPVPDGFVLTDDALASGPIGPQTATGRRILEMWQEIRASRVAVRSSGLNEDGAGKSYAGVFESVLNVTIERLLESVDEVRSSLKSERAASYGGNAEERGGIVVQKMVAAEYAGVLFTEHPTSAGSFLVELVEGLGDSLVSGNRTPRAFRFGRSTLTLQESEAPPIDLEPLLKLACGVERHFGKPQDIEWAFATGKFYILQARDITRLASDGTGPRERFEAERRRLLASAVKLRPGASTPAPRADDVVFAQNELAELLPRPTPYSLELMETLWAPGGATDLACRDLGIPYDVVEDGPSYIESVFGALYVRRSEARLRMAKGTGALAAFRLSRSAQALEEEYRQAIPELVRTVSLREALDLTRLPLEALFELLREWSSRFVAQTYVLAERINLAADFYLKAARAEVEKRGLDAMEHLGQVHGSIVHEAMSMLPAVARNERPAADFLRLFGHRAPLDYELAQPRYRDSPELVQELVARAQDRPAAPAGEELPPPEAPADRLFGAVIERARRFQVLKEEAKHNALRELAALRPLLLEIGARTGLDEDIFQLTQDEILRLGDDAWVARCMDVAEARRLQAEEWAELRLPTELSLSDLESLTAEGRVPVSRAGQGELQGVRVSGQKDVKGRVRVVRSQGDIASFQPGEILVARYTDPTWTPLFPQAAGVITEVGGWLSHAAIVAREYGVTAIVGAAGALDRLETGDLVELLADGRVHKAGGERRGAPRRIDGAEVAIARQGSWIQGRLRDYSATGAFLHFEDELAVGQEVTVRLNGAGGELRARVVRREQSGGYALEFAAPPSSATGEGAGRN